MTRLAFLKTLGLFLAQRPGGFLPGFGQTHGLSAPTVNITGPNVSEIDEGDETCRWDITYSGNVTAYNLIDSEITKVGTPLGTTTVFDGTTSTPYVNFTSSSGLGNVSIIVQAGAVQNGGVNNIQSAASSTCEVVDGGK